MKILTSTILCISLLAGCTNSYKINTLAKGDHCSVGKNLELVINDLGLFDKVWKKTSNGLIPEIDFSKETIIAVYSGTKPTSGYSIEIIKIEDSRLTTNIYLKETKPKPEDITLQVITSPYHIIKTTKLSKGARFIK